MVQPESFHVTLGLTTYTMFIVMGLRA